jgi:eukaryotic-like serine/threonine-protein kinase
LTDQLEQPWLIALAADVCDGKRVDWAQVQEHSTDAQSEVVLRGLQRLARVVDAHRGEPEPASPAPTSAELKVWRHLMLLEVVGSGAFGTVYRAWDAQLQREVALKRVTSAGRKPWTEAQHLARIHHPHVVTVYGAEQDEQGVGIWMEFIEGQTLAEIVQERGPMSAREVAGIGIDVCRALSALHSAGLLHRDIKAHNVMREVGGRIVLMDFSGTGAVEGNSAEQLSGTPLYMAPELFEGSPASPASDTYSLGVLLFYLFSGRLPVEGASLSEVRAAHVASRRIRLRDLRPELPDLIVQIVERATSADPAARYATAGEFEHALAGVLGPTVTASVTSAARPAGIEAQSRSRAFAWVAAITTLLIGGLTAGLLLRPEPSSAGPQVQFTIGPPYNTGSWPRVSPDGRFVVFGSLVEGRSVFWLRALNSAEGRPIPGTTATETPFWSPEARQLAFFADGKLKTVEIETNRIENLSDVTHPFGGDWNASGVLLFATDTGIDRINADGSQRRHVTTLDTARQETRHGWPEFLPDGRRFLYLVRSRIPEESGVYLGSIDSPTRKRIMPGYSRVAYASSGHLLFVRNGTLFSHQFDAASAEAIGEPVAIAQPVKYHAADDAAFDVSTNGVLIYRSNEGPALSRVLLLDRRGRELQAVAPEGLFRQPRLSPEGTRVVVEKTAPGESNADLWMFDLSRHTSMQLTRNPGPDIRPVWSPDGHEIVFSSRRGATLDVYRRAVDEVREEEVLWASPDNKRVEDWSRDGRMLAVSVPRKGLWTFSLDTRKPTLIRTITGSDNGMQAEFSPDGRLIAYANEESGRPEVYVQVVSPAGARWQVSTEGGAEPHWRDDGRELMFVGADGWMTSVELSDGPRWNPGPPRKLFRVSLPTLFGGSNISISKDAERIVLNSAVADPAVPPIYVLINSPPFSKR